MATVAELAEEVDPEAVRIGRVLRNLRESLDRTLQDVGAALGRHHSYLSRIERGFHRPAKQHALIPGLAAVYGISTDEILDAIYPPGGPHQRPAGLELAMTASQQEEEGER